MKIVEKLGHRFELDVSQTEYYSCINCGLIIFKDAHYNLYLSDLNENFYTDNDLRKLGGIRYILNISCEEMIIKKLLE